MHKTVKHETAYMHTVVRTSSAVAEKSRDDRHIKLTWNVK